MTDFVANPLDAQARRMIQRWFMLPLAVGAVIGLIWGWLAAVPGPITAIDIQQHRAGTAAAIPDGDAVLQQTLRPLHGGLSEIELLAVVYDHADVTPDGTLTLAVATRDGTAVAERTFRVADVRHNQALTLRFAPQRDSAETPYTLTIRGHHNQRVTVWGYELDAYSGGTLTQPAPATAAQDLRFIARYSLTPALALHDLRRLLPEAGAILVAALLIIPLPGYLLLRVLPRRRGDAVAWWGMAFAAGWALWALLWQWTTLVNLHWQAPALWAVCLVGWALLAWDRFRRPDPIALPPFTWHNAALAGVLGLGYALRLLAVRDLAFLPWVDASRHGLITAIMSATGQSLTTYEPWLPVAQGRYHYGFHAVAATLHLLLGGDLARLLLHLQQILSVLAALAAYAGATLLTGRRHVGLLAAFLVALPFFLPAYYVSWGRLTQMTGMVLLPLLLGLAWRVARGPTEADAPPVGRLPGGVAVTGEMILLAVLTAGLFLVHFRVLLMFVPFVALVWLFHLARGTRGLAVGLAAAGVLVAPRLLELAAQARAVSVFRPIPSAGEFPVGYLQPGWERFFLVAGAISIAAALIAFVLGRRWPVVPLLLALWVAGLLALLAGRRLGLPETWVINLNSVYISVYLPLAWVLAIAAETGWEWLRRQHWLLQLLGYGLAGGFLGAAVAFSIPFQTTIVAEQTVLAQRADRPALAWIDANLPPDSRIAVSSWLWLGTTWAGSDGGAWIMPVTGRYSSTPPVDYIYDRTLATDVAAFNTAAQAIADWSTPEAADLLRQYGLTHVYVGARGGFLRPEQLARNAALTLRYSRDGVFVFALRE